MPNIIGMPVYGSNHENVYISKSLKSVNDIPNPEGADIGADISFDSEFGMKSVLNNVNDADGYIKYDGPYSSTPVTAWGGLDTFLSNHHGFTIHFEVEKSVFENGVDAMDGTGSAAFMEFRGAINNGFIQFQRGGTIGDTTYNGSILTGHPGFSNNTAYFSQYGRVVTGDYVHIAASIRRGYMDIYVDGYLATTMEISPIANGFDDLYLCGRQYKANSAPTGFPFYTKNFEILLQPIVTTISSTFDRIVMLGDSIVEQGDFFIGSPNYNASHAGSNADAGMSPMTEKLLANSGHYVSDLHNSGRTGTRMLYVATQTGLIDQVDGTNIGTVYDANEIGSHIAFIHCGLNDILSETSIIANIKAEAKLVIETMLAGRFTHIFLANIYDAQNASGVSNSAATIISRTTDLNAAYAELASEINGVFLVDIHAAIGEQDNSKFRADLYHPTEEIQSIIARTFYAKLISVIA